MKRAAWKARSATSAAATWFPSRLSHRCRAEPADRRRLHRR
jgi:hypothetical protein